MEFDRKKFEQARFEPRTEEVPVPDLAGFFSGLAKKEVPGWKVRGLTGPELGQCNEAAENNRKIGAILEGLVGQSSKEIKAAIKELTGNGEAVPQDIAKRLSMLVIGSVDPAVDRPLAVRLCEYYPIEFFQLTNKITTLTGQGHMPGKPPGSGKAKK
ncbi:MAG: hypothetical protein P1P81_04420 [Desulfobulbales bacterium]|nr:hypothetical protein [Desulfobulbales bacterium]